MKQFITCALTALTLGVILPLNVAADEAVNSIKIDNSGNVTLMSDQAEKDGITAVQLSLKVKADPDADISFEFNSENNVKVSEYRYHAESSCLNIYLSNSGSLFGDSDLLDIGAVSAKDTAGNSIAVKVDAVENSLKYVYQNILTEVAFNVETAPAETTTATQSTTTITTTTTTQITTTTTIQTTTTTTQPTTITTTTTTQPETTTTTTTTQPETAMTTTTTAITEAVTTETTNNHIASDEEFCDWAISDYQSKTGITAVKAEINENAEGQYEIALFDASENVLDTYVIDPNTGVGTNSANQEVNLPQTGNNLLTNLLIAFGALILMGLGFYTVKISGVIRHKKNEK